MELAAIISLLGVISGIVLGWLGKAKSEKKEIQEEAANAATIQSDVEYIKRGVDEMRLEQKDQGRRFDALSERVTRVEESAKQAHHRLNRLDGGRKGE